MARYTRGKHAVLMDDIFGRKIKYKDARTQWDGMRVYKGDFTTKQPQLEPQKFLKNDGPDVLSDPRPDSDSVPVTVRLQYIWTGGCEIQSPHVGLSQYFGVTGFNLPLNNGISGITLKLIEQPSGFGMTAYEGSAGLVHDLTEIPPGIATTMHFNDSIVLNTTENATGIETTTSQGTITLNADELPAGIAATMSQGTITLFIAQTAYATMTALAASQGTTILALAVEASSPAGLTAATTDTTEDLTHPVTSPATLTTYEGSAGLLHDFTEIPSGITITAQENTAGVTFIVSQVITPTGLTMTSAQGTISPATIAWGLHNWNEGTWGYGGLS